MRALTLRQPHAEAIMRGRKQIDHRPGTTNVRGRVYIYASLTRLTPEEEEDWLDLYGIKDISSDELPRGVIVGTVELYDCTEDDGEFNWHLRNPERESELLAPKNKPLGIWFNPF